jgi:hypothetical protein
MLKTNKNYEKFAPIKTFDQEIKVIDGVKQVVYTERTRDAYEGLSYTDFSLQSLIDADATDLLQSVGTLSRGQLTVADFADYCANSISDNLGALENNEVKNDDER